MKKELSPAVIAGTILGVIVALGLVIFFSIRSDPAAQGPHPPPRFDPVAKAAESHGIR